MNNFRINMGYYLTKHLNKVAKATKGAIVLDEFVTLIALALSVDPASLSQPLGSAQLDIESCITIKMIVR